MGSLQDSDLLTDTKIAIKSLVISSPLGISLTKLCRDFEDIEGKEVPYKELGFATLTDLLKSMKDMVRPIFDANQSVTLFPVVDDSTAHITDLVANQSTKRLRARSAKRSKSLNRSVPKRRPVFTSQLRRSLQKPTTSQSTPRTPAVASNRPLRTPQNTPLNRSQISPAFTRVTPQTRSPHTSAQNPLKRPLNTSQRMDPRIAKRLNTTKDDEKEKTATESMVNGSGDTNAAAAKPAPPEPTPTPTKPFHMMQDQEVEALVSAVRLTTTVTSVADNAKNGIDPQMWSDIFSVEKVTDLKPMSIETNGMLAQKTVLRQPLKIGEYSLKISTRSDNRIFIPDGSELKYLHLPPAISQLSYDLNHGYDMVSDIHWGKPSNSKIDELLQWILRNRKKFMVAGELVPKELHTDFVCYRGLLAKIMTTPYETSHRWVICATKYRGTIYLCQFHESYPPPDDYYNKMSFGGFRFESFVTSYDPTIPPDPNDFDPDHHEYCAVMRSRLMAENVSHSLAFGAELDCVVPNLRENPGTLSNFVELKTTKVMAKEFQYRNFLKHKLLKWWAQSYLVGVPSIYCGYKDEKNVVKDVEQLKIESFPELCLEFWSANVCLNFLNKFLLHLKELVTIDDPNVVYQLAFQPHHDITCTRLVEPGDFQILPQWYIDEFAV